MATALRALRAHPPPLPTRNRCGRTLPCSCALGSILAGGTGDAAEEAGWRHYDAGLEAVQRMRGTEAGGVHEDRKYLRLLLQSFSRLSPPSRSQPRRLSVTTPGPLPASTAAQPLHFSVQISGQVLHQAFFLAQLLGVESKDLLMRMCWWKGSMSFLLPHHATTDHPADAPAMLSNVNVK